MPSSRPLPLPNRPSSGRRAGFTLLELLISLAVASIGLSIAVPGFRGIYLDQLRTTAVNDLTYSVRYARSKAVTRQLPVSLCILGTAGAGQADPHAVDKCSPVGGWESGWLIFIDNNGNGQREDNEMLLRRHDALATSVSMKGNTNLASRITFNSQGMTSDNGTITYCDPRSTGDEVRSIVLAVSGRVRIEADKKRRGQTSTACP